MNIKDAKQQISNAMKAYFTKDEFGNYIIPIERQRPVFLMGPPGIGKTAVMEQVASDLGVGLISYSMTHHTRQSALGLPFIVHKTYGGKEYDVSEYTMSEIIASVYDMIETTGLKEGILFLDEINCVSETLSPIMLQFLQYKIFGRHRVPDGWIVVTAGNPPEYNNSVREFDIVTWDRLKRIDIEPEFDCWKEYAHNHGVHPAVLTYLEIKKNNFYKIESTVDGKSFVTARGWDDLSQMIKLYEINKIDVDLKLVSQYVQDKKIAKDFAVYYDLFNKYRSDYRIDSIFAGEADDEIKQRARNARFDERLSLIGLLLDGLGTRVKESIMFEDEVTELMGVLKTFKKEIKDANAEKLLSGSISEISADISRGKASGSMSSELQHKKAAVIRMLDAILTEVKLSDNKNDAFAIAKKYFDSKVTELKAQSQKTGKAMSNAFIFCDEVFGNGQEMLILVTELTMNGNAAKFISRFGCKEYFAHNKELLFYERQQEIITELEKLDIDE